MGTKTIVSGLLGSVGLNPLVSSLFHPAQTNPRTTKRLNFIRATSIEPVATRKFKRCKKTGYKVL